ncbi:hypothetical protein ACFL3C_03465 [Patescibacteria group bacterium]
MHTNLDVMNSPARRERIFKLLKRFDKKLVKFYLDEGPYELRKKLDIKEDDLWKMVFDYLLYEKNIVKTCVKQNAEYIHEMFADKGPEMIRKSFRLMENEYEDQWEYVMDYIGISRGSVYEYVSNNVSDLRSLIYHGKATKIREMLLLNKAKYDKVWEDILDLLLESVSTDAYTYSMFEQGIRMFSNLYNNGREHRSIRSLSSK